MRVVEVLGEHKYPVVVGSGVINQVAGSLDRDYARALIIHPAAVRQIAREVGAQLEQAGIATSYFVHADGESGKTVEQLSAAWEAAGDCHIGRRDLIVGVGGGATTDLAGFVAATWLRGVSVLQVPTSLLAMVDAAVGGKTGINTRHGKNLAGAFHSPIAVIADTDCLATLPEAEFRAGLGEIIKCGFIRDETILDLASEPITKTSAQVVDLVEKAVRVKADVVGVDLKESGEREILNYGHTLAHVIEKVSGYQIRHGEAVSIGIVFAAHVAVQLGLADEDWLGKQRRLLATQGLPTSWHCDSMHTILDVMSSDKKVRSGQVRMVLTTQSGHTLVQVVEPATLHAAALKMGVVDD
ncbi:3-dehydroquinate synthase [Actinomyces urinae]|uniref:3-dehydroquinate synthase n=1 Tax=Actinomyces urinae TaxID=1689268 RepID=UPI0009316B7D|nr:3-dehydroquinate synthase [Actinomyces urinae]